MAAAGDAARRGAAGRGGRAPPPAHRASLLASPPGESGETRCVGGGRGRGERRAARGVRAQVAAAPAREGRAKSPRPGRARRAQSSPEARREAAPFPRSQAAASCAPDTGCARRRRPAGRVRVWERAVFMSAACTRVDLVSTLSTPGTASACQRDRKAQTSVISARLRPSPRTVACRAGNRSVESFV